jgi:hypothetical protein
MLVFAPSTAADRSHNSIHAPYGIA